MEKEQKSFLQKEKSIKQKNQTFKKNAKNEIKEIQCWI
jgi:hypothetical protein